MGERANAYPPTVMAWNLDGDGDGFPARGRRPVEGVLGSGFAEWGMHLGGLGI